MTDVFNEFRAAKQGELVQAESDVALGAMHIARQERRVAELKRDGHDTSLAEDLLQTFRDCQVSHEDHRKLIKEELAAASVGERHTS
jgi:hypothetical protein